MATIRRFGAEYEYILKEDRKLPPDEQTRWIYKLASMEAQNLDTGDVILKDINEVTEEVGSAKVKSPNSVKNHFKVIKECLIRVENLRDDEGNEVKWDNNDGRRRNLVASLPASMRRELVGVFLSGASIDEEQEKNSDSGHA